MDHATPKKPAVRIEMDEDFARALEDWRRQQAVIPSRAEAVRQLAARSLAADHAAA
jgi:hypothetical protein